MNNYRSLVLISLPFLLFAFVSFILTQKACDRALQVEAKKPIPFNHKSHVQDYGIGDCETCHSYDKNGRFKGIPTIADCKTCHSGDSSKEKVLFNGFADHEKPWESYSKQPHLVYFSHIAVMKNKKQARCMSCHRDKEISTTTARVGGKITMKNCMHCHEALHISNTCIVCHK